MKNIVVSRNIFTDKSTIGDLFFDGEFVTNTLEDTARHIKEAKKTAIPAGDYKIELRFSKKFDRIMPFLLDVPFFEGVMIHWGNSNVDTDGCLLVGHYDKSQPDWLSSSRKAFDVLYPLIEKEIASDGLRVRINGGINKADFAK